MTNPAAKPCVPSATECAPHLACEPLRLVLLETEEHTPKRRGAGLEEWVSMSGAVGVAYRAHAKGKLYMLNFCPFCGSRAFVLRGVKKTVRGGK